MTKRLRVRVPHDTTTLIGATGDHVNTYVDEAGHRWADLLEDDARRILCSGLPHSVPWRELNQDLAKALGPPPPLTGVNIRALQAAIEDSHPVSPTDKGGITNQTFAMLGRARW